MARAVLATFTWVVWTRLKINHHKSSQIITNHHKSWIYTKTWRLPNFTSQRMPTAASSEWSGSPQQNSSAVLFSASTCRFQWVVPNRKPMHSKTSPNQNHAKTTLKRSASARPRLHSSCPRNPWPPASARPISGKSRSLVLWSLFVFHLPNLALHSGRKPTHGEICMVCSSWEDRVKSLHKLWPVQKPVLASHWGSQWLWHYSN